MNSGVLYDSYSLWFFTWYSNWSSQSFILIYHISISPPIFDSVSHEAIILATSFMSLLNALSDMLKGGVGWVRDGDMSSLLLTDGEQGGAWDSSPLKGQKKCFLRQEPRTFLRLWKLSKNKNTAWCFKISSAWFHPSSKKSWCFKMFWLKRFQLLPPFRALGSEIFEPMGSGGAPGRWGATTEEWQTQKLWRTFGCWTKNSWFLPPKMGEHDGSKPYENGWFGGTMIFGTTYFFLNKSSRRFWSFVIHTICLFLWWSPNLICFFQ